ncbi:MAG: DNA mismatch repair protein MutS [Acidobacteria bacterium]|nr:DNA mismatch repair protein MutS [Acidobacteriota bacterium]
MEKKKIKDNLTPAMKQYREIKRRHKDAILFFRMGDFYEMFFEDAITCSRELEIALTSRTKSEEGKIPMCGVPYHAVEGYITKLIRRGYKVAICEQVEDPKQAKGIVRREVVRIITPGTALDSSLLEEKEGNYLAAILPEEDRVGISFIELSTGEFTATEISSGDIWEKVVDELNHFKTSELIIPEGIELPNRIKEEFPLITITPLSSWIFSPDYAPRMILEHFGVSSLAPFGLEGFPLASSAAGALLHYLKETQKSELSHIESLSYFNTEDYMVIDSATVRNLELTRSAIDGSREGSLLGVIDFTVTGMGGRKLRSWLLRPLKGKKEIEERLSGVEELVNDPRRREKLRSILKRMHDIGRLVGRISVGTAMPRDLIALGSSLARLPEIREEIAGCYSKIIGKLQGEIDPLEDVRELIEKAIVDEPPATVREGGLIKDGFSYELDELRKISREGKGYIASLEEKERKRTGISSLKVGYNKVFGYYIEVSKANLSLVPDDYIRKQTLVGGERFITPELKEYEAKVLTAEERIGELEYQLFLEVREKVSQAAGRIKKTADALATLDVLCSLAEVAVRNRYTRPKITEGDEIKIIAGRHPVVEEIMKDERFIPNDCYLNTDTHQILIITGPNMGGKSTYLRQVALITIMAQMGSFVPADEAEIGLVDRVFTRVGASDNLARGQSTFLIEMMETANILNNATKKSLIVLDEIGRGTSTFDGVSIAWAVAEFLHHHPRIGAKTLFATHYHELADLALTLPGIKNFNVAVKEWKGNLVFLRKVVEGASDKSYGIQVAKLAGLPRSVIARAEEILTNLERDEFTPQGEPKLAARRSERKKKEGKEQLSLFDDFGHPIVEELKKVDVDRLTPIDALNLIHRLKKKLE